MRKKYKYVFLLSLIINLSACDTGNSGTTSSSEITNSSFENASDITSPITDSQSSTDTEPTSSSSSSTTNDNHDSYYLGTSGLSGSALKSKLHSIITSTHKDKISYDNCDSYIAAANEDPDNTNNLILFYTGVSKNKLEHVQGTADPAFWNKEHVYAKSHGNFASQLAGRDLHHLMPTDNGVNNKRASLDFDDVDNKGGTAITSYNSYGKTVTVSYAYSDPLDRCFVNSNAFEPCNAYKGDVARILFYMAVRYEGGDGGPNLELNDSYNNDSATTLGKLSTLRKWHIQDPVDDFERNRNEKIFSFQGNRNPFIDYPEFVDLLTW